MDATFSRFLGPPMFPDRVLRALSRPVIDHRRPEFAALGAEVLANIKLVFKTTSPVLIFPSSGTGAWEAALVNTLSPGDRILMYETGHFALLWCEMAQRLGLDVVLLPGDWRHGANAEAIEQALRDDRSHQIRAVAIVHNETSTGVTSNMKSIRETIDAVGHPTLLMVDTISSLGSMDYQHDEWSVDVTVGGSQKGLMLPPGLGFNAVSEKAMAANRDAGLPRSYWEWTAMLGVNESGFSLTRQRPTCSTVCAKG